MLDRFKFKQHVQFSHSNQTGDVHFDVYVRLMEETEYAFLRSRGLRVVLDDGKGIIGFPRISAQIEIIEPVQFGDLVETTLQLMQVDGKSIVYDFVLNCRERPAAKGRFEAACCRFPEAKDPYAILIPDFVIEKLQQQPNRAN